MLKNRAYIWGYVEYSVEREDVSTVIELLLRAEIGAVQKDAVVVVNAKNAREVDALLDTRVKFSRSEVKGIRGIFCKSIKCYGALLAIAFSMALLFLSSKVVWSVRIEGNAIYSEREIIEELESCGLSLGERWSKIDTGRIEGELLSKSDSISWLNINRRGSVAYVKVIEKTVFEENENIGYTNVVAKCDAIIEEITVVSGVAKVQVGESVKKGDLLISGVIPRELGGGFCYAEGVVKGRVSDVISVNVADSYEEKCFKESSLKGISLSFFNFPINIFKSYRNLDIECDIIENKEQVSFCKKTLPFEIIKSYRLPYEIKTRRLSEEEMISIASDRITDVLASRFEESLLLKISTKGEFEKNGYKMQTEFVCIEDIMENVPFEISAGE